MGCILKAICCLKEAEKVKVIKMRYRQSSAYNLIELFHFLILSCMNSLYILHILPDISFANIFFHSAGCLSVSLMVLMCKSFLV